MKKLKGTILTLLVVYIGYPAIVFAQNVGQVTIPNPSGYNSLEELINAGLSLLRPLFIVTFAAMIMYGAWTWLTSQGDAEKIGRARKIIIAAVIGFAIAVLAPSIAGIVANFIKLQGFNGI